MSPPRKKGKKEEVATTGSSNSGVIRFGVDKISELDRKGRCSPEIEVKGVPWSAFVNKIVDGDGQYVSINFMCTQLQSSLWIIEVTAVLVLIHADNVENEPFEKSRTFRSDGVTETGWPIKWNVIEEKNGFVKDDKLTFEIRFKINKMEGIRLFHRVNFTDPSEPGLDTTLLINGEKIYVNKGILTFQSPFFKALFNGNFDEKNKSEIEIKEVDREEFIEMLQVIQPPAGKMITEASAEFLLHLGDRFQIAKLSDNAEQVIKHSPAFENLEKLRIADKYRLFGLLHHCLSSLQTAKDFKDVTESSIYGDLSNATKAALFERMVKTIN